MTALKASIPNFPEKDDDECVTVKASSIQTCNATCNLENSGCQLPKFRLHSDVGAN